MNSLPELSADFRKEIHTDRAVNLFPRQSPPLDSSDEKKKLIRLSIGITYDFYVLLYRKRYGKTLRDEQIDI